MDGNNRFTGRRHSVDAVAIANMKKHEKTKETHEPLPRITNPIGQNRRHSVMIVPPPYRRLSMTPWNARKTSRNLSIFSMQSNALTTFSGLPIVPQPKIEVENTYKLEPDDGKQFKAHIVKKAVKEVFDEMLEESDYMQKDHKKKGYKQWSKASDSSEGGRLAKILVSEVTDKVKTLAMDRYKFVVNAFVGECKGQGMLIASRGLWNTSTDGHVTVECKTATHFAVVVVHAVYFE